MDEAEAIRRRTRICIWIIILGLLNFLAFGIIYAYIGGEAVNGGVTQQSGRMHYFIRTPSQQLHPVSNGIFWYSGIHSISIWVTFGAVMLAMLTLAKDRIIDSMHSAVVRGRALLTILATIITTIAIVCTVWGGLAFASKLTNPEKRPPAATRGAMTQTSAPARP